MLSAWNWIGILIWLLVGVYFFWMIDNVHSRKKQMLKTAQDNRRHALTSSVAVKNFEITSLEIIILFALLFGMGHTTFHHYVTNHNSYVASKVLPLDHAHTKVNVKHPTQKIHYYYVKVNRSRTRSLRQKYDFRINGQNMWALNTNAMVTTNLAALKNNINLPERANEVVTRELRRHRHSQRADAIRIVTVYKNSFANGLGMHAGQKKFYYTILVVPNHSGIYVNKRVQRNRSVK